MKVNIGKNTLGDNNKMSVSLKEYGRSTHDLSYAWRSPMGVGTLVPFMKILALPGDTFNIDLDTKVLTHPTVGPLFGQFKMQMDVFTCPLRLYQAQLHNNALNIGLDMKKVKLPKFENNFKVLEGDAKPYRKTKKSGKGSLAEYLGLKYEPIRDKVNLVNAIPYFAYYDIFKNYYANKQEDYFMLMGGSIIVDGGTVTTNNDNNFYNVDANGNWGFLNNTLPEKTLTITMPSKLWETYKSTDQVEAWFTLTDGREIKCIIQLSGGEQVEITGEIATINIIGQKHCRCEVSKGVLNEYTDYQLTGMSKIVSKGTEVKTYTSSYKLEEIDNLREYILKQGKKEIVIKSTSNEEWLGTSFIKDVLVGTSDGNSGAEPRVKKPIIQMEMGGLCLKTLQSDIFNNWVNKEWVDGDNGINAVTDVAITDGKLNLDSLNIAQKVYNMLNRIAVSGGSYKDWIETVYTTDYYFRAETPVYEGGMSSIIDFEAVVSNSASTASGVEEPLGSLAGRGYNGQKKGGKLEIKVNEPCYIMGIASITPLVDYSQGNDWDNWLETMDDLHKPQLDGIGYQDLMQNKMHGLAKPSLAVGKQPAWLDYMTNFNKTFADFAAGQEESYMVLNRIYNVNDEGEITNATTYINPKDYTYIFATNTETNRDFWVQIGCGITARRVMSAAQIPLM